MGWPWTNKDNSVDKDTIKIIVDENKRLEEERSELQRLVKKLNGDIRELQAKQYGKDLLTSWLSVALGDRAKDRKLKAIEYKDTSDLLKESKQLKATIKSYQNRLRTYTSGLAKNRFEVIDDINSIIDKFLTEEDPMFIKYVKGPLDKAEYYEKLATKQSITLNNERDLLIKILEKLCESTGTPYPIVDAFIRDILCEIAEVLYSRAMYKPFVRRSISMNNKTKDMLQEIQDKLMLLNDQYSEELINLRMENGRLKQDILLMTEKDDNLSKIAKLEQEINNLKVENEALRYKGGRRE